VLLLVKRGIPQTLVVAMALLALGCSDVKEPGTAKSVQLSDAPLLKQPTLSVTATGVIQTGRRLELSAVLRNRSKTLDAREAVVVLVAFDADGRPLAERPRELPSIPAGARVAVAEALVLETGVRAARAEAHVGLPDAAVTRAPEPITLIPVDVALHESGESLLLTGRIQPSKVYPVTYRVEAVVLDSGKIVASAEGEFRPKSNARTPFSIRGLLRPGPDLRAAQAIVTIMPLAGREE
jgi:hypothetical protein